jgi:HEPN domain-containing protein
MSGLGDAMWRQAVSDLAHARRSLDAGDHDWTVFAAQQAAEKGLKAVLLAAGRPAPSVHPLTVLFDDLVRHGLAQPSERAPLEPAMAALIQGWAMARYPLAGIEIAPTDLITRDQAVAALGHADAILGFCRSRGVGAA